MIRFTLQCEDGHQFEAWFGGNDDYDDQTRRGLLACPICDSPNVSKALMAPNVSTSKKDALSGVDKAPQEQGLTQDAALPKNSAQNAMPVAQGGLSPEVIAKVYDVVRHIRAVSDNVGKNFAKEARDIHDGVAPERPIIGEASAEAIQDLLEDDIPIAPLPALPEDKH